MGKGKALNICLTILLSLAVANAPAFAAKTIYVDADATGANDGSSWTDAYRFLQDALTDANSSAKPVEIRVAQGVYTPDSNSAVPDGTGDREATFQLISGVTLKGGYAGFGQPNPNVRDTRMFETILSGDLGEPFEDADNSYHVVGSNRTDETALLEGFTVTGGNANGGFAFPDTRLAGGGLYNHDSDAVVTNCRFENNCACEGGAIYNFQSNPTLENCIFNDNDADKGGAIYNSASSPTIEVCVFTDNAAFEDGGAVHNNESSPILTNCILWDDTPDEISGDDGSLVAYCDVQGGCPGTGNIDADPCFADPNNDDYHLKSQAGRWNPNDQTWVIDAVTSPCIDAGDISGPVGRERFPNGGIINMGAYGGTAEASKSYFGRSTCPFRMPADINGDCKVDPLDLRIMLAQWLKRCETSASGHPMVFGGDLDRDCDVGPIDFAILGHAWGEQYRP